MQIKVLDKELYTLDELLPKTVGSAGIDLKLVRDTVSYSDLSKDKQLHDLVGTGIAVAIPEGFVGLLAPRSSSGHKRGFKLGNTLGVLDSDYRGEIKLSICLNRMNTFKRGETVAQLFVVPVFDWAQASVVEEFSLTTKRGDGGFGSTDK